jgi:hypothetical protein
MIVTNLVNTKVQTTEDTKWIKMLYLLQLGFDRYGHTDTDTDMVTDIQQTDTDTPFQNLHQTDTDIWFEIHIKPIPIIGIYLY